MCPLKRPRDAFRFLSDTNIYAYRVPIYENICIYFITHCNIYRYFTLYKICAAVFRPHIGMRRCSLSKSVCMCQNGFVLCVIMNLYSRFLCCKSGSLCLKETVLLPDGFVLRLFSCRFAVCWCAKKPCGSLPAGLLKQCLLFSIGLCIRRATAPHPFLVRQ